MTEPKPTVPEVAPLVRALYDRHSAGCCLHVVLDDQNVHDVFVLSCHDAAVKAGHEDCAHLARLLMRMSKTQRLKVGGAR